MNPAEIRARLAALGMTQSGFARMAGCSARQVRRWASGEAEMPHWAALILLLLELPGAMDRARQLTSGAAA